MSHDVISRKVFILFGQSYVEGFTAELAEAYEHAALAAGHEVRRVNLGEIRFDPILHKGYNEVQPLETDLVMVQEHIRWADHFVVVYPNWWLSMPAILKGLFDRIWLPGFAFHFEENDHGVVELFEGKTARVIVTDGARHPFVTRLKYGDYTNEISRGILGFSGMKVHITTMGPSEHPRQAKHDAWIAEIRELGTHAI